MSSGTLNAGSKIYKNGWRQGFLWHTAICSLVSVQSFHFKQQQNLTIYILRHYMQNGSYQLVKQTKNKFHSLKAPGVIQSRLQSNLPVLVPRWTRESPKASLAPLTPIQNRLLALALGNALFNSLYHFLFYLYFSSRHIFIWPVCWTILWVKKCSTRKVLSFIWI